MKTVVNYIVSCLSKDKSIRKAILFGSRAKRGHTPNSDLDLLVIKDTRNSSYLEKYTSVSLLFEPRHYSIDLLVKTPQEYKKRVRFGDPLLLEIEKTGKLVYER
jgi:predicted nucleotidyltransferase